MIHFIVELFENYKHFSRNAKLFLLGGIFNGIGLSVFGLLYNLYLKNYGYFETDIGHILSYGSLGATIIAIPAAIAIQKVHIKHVLIFSTILACLSYWGSVQFKGIQAIYLFTFFANMFITAYRVAIAPFFMANSSQKERIWLFSIHSALMMLSQLLGFIIGGYLPKILLWTQLVPNQTIAYEWSLYTSVIGTILSMIPFLFITKVKTTTPLKNPLSIKSYNFSIIGKLIIPKAFVGLGAGLVIPFMNLYYRDLFHLDSDRIGFIFSLMQVALFLGMISAPKLTHRFGMLHSIILTEVLSIPFMFILAVTNNLSLAIVAFVFRGTLMNMNLPISANFEMELVKPHEQALTNAVSTIAWNGAWTISAHFGGAIIQRYSFSYSFYLTIVFYTLSAIAYYLFFRKYARSKQTV